MQALQRLKAAHVKVFAFTNQHRIHRGDATVNDFEEEFASLGFDGALICPHDPQDGCPCHKPRPGLLLRAAQEHPLDLHRCVVIGDVGATDMLAAGAVGAVKILVLTGWGKGSMGKYRPTWASVEPEKVASNLLDAVHWILSEG